MNDDDNDPGSGSQPPGSAVTAQHGHSGHGAASALALLQQQSSELQAGPQQAGPQQLGPEDHAAPAGPEA